MEQALIPLWDTFHYKEHQVVGVKWMLEREADDEVSGGILADEMGLGKTIQFLGLIKNSKKSHTILIAPVAVIEQWRFTAERSHIRCYMLKDGHWILNGKMFHNASSLYLCSYETAQRNLNAILKMSFDRLICDEAHRLANQKTIGYQTVEKIKTPSRWFLTATPIVNSEKDVYSLFKLLGIKDTNLYHCAPIYILSRSMEQLRAKIPDAPKTPIVITHKLDFLSNEEAEFYRGIQGKILNQLRYGQVNGLEKLALLMYLRQLSIHPNVYVQMKRKSKIYIKSFENSSAKFEKIKELLYNEKSENHKWIIFCQFHEEMIMLQEHLKCIESIRHVGIYSGKLKQDERSNMLEKFQEPFDSKKNTDVLLIQLKSGGVGLNLQQFDRIIFCSPWWTRAMMDQAVGRAVRLGQKNQVIVHHLHLNEEETVNIDRMMNDYAEGKGEMNKRILKLANNDI